MYAILCVIVEPIFVMYIFDVYFESALTWMTRLHWWEVNPPLLEPMLTQIRVALWRHQATVDWKDELFLDMIITWTNDNPDHICFTVSQRINLESLHNNGTRGLNNSETTKFLLPIQIYKKLFSPISLLAMR